MTLPESKVCSMCKEDKLQGEFTMRSGGKGLQSRCRVCAGEAARASQNKLYSKDDWNKRMVEYRTTESGRVAWIKIKAKRTGLTGAEVDKVIAAFLDSDGSCEICKKVPQDEGNKHGLSIDHCHDKLIFRGLLCSQCNTMLGYSKDNPEVLIAGAKYLDK